MFDEAGLQQVIQRRAPIYDKAQEGHYNLISALHKTIRGSDPDAALYYFCRMCDAGEDPRFLARRLVRMAVEDIGLADPQALIHARAAAEAYEQLGHRAKIECCLHGVQGGLGHCQAGRIPDAAEDHSQRADEIHERRRLWCGLCL
jgi:replication-associated recombination protein RarA